MNLKLSRYTILINAHPDGYYLFNAVNKEIVHVGRKTYQKITKGQVDDLDQKTKSILMEKNILMEENIDEARLIEYWLNEFKFRREIAATILTTYQCNLACTYCYQKGVGKINKSLAMSEKVAGEVVSFLTELVEAKNPKILTLEFYGGEPLLNLKLIKKIAKALKAICLKNNSRFTFGIMTNGLLLNQALVKSLKNLGLWQIQISLDGPPEIHDKRRPLKSGEGSFRRILHVLKNITRDFTPTIRINIDETNYKEIPKLLKILGDQKLKDKVRLYFAPTIYSSKSKRLTSCQICSPAYHKSLTPKIAHLINLTFRKGFSLAQKYYSVSPCHYYLDNGFIIDPKGDVFKCLAIPKTKAGNVKNHFLNLNHIRCVETNPWKNEKCLSCCYLPLCFGGCRYKALIQTGDEAAVFCEKEMFETVGGKLIEKALSLKLEVAP